ncbi:MAG TPA: chromosomal replication initiator protein DnaA [Candidatus Tripitaka californicus]|uniref:chromosomal replication initiator protein DnaA n=1 Tax=Candidatus Tripitaka californicus TaxID=3367616 RepID=UPI0040295DDB|nr:chromosomal replication initiator protein DnaA [Planctomycetota bacterium]
MGQSCSEIWAGVLGNIQKQVGTITFNLWFRDTELLSFCSNRCEIGVPNSFIGVWLQRHFLAIIQEKLTGAIGGAVEVGFSINSNNSYPPQAVCSSPGVATIDKPAANTAVGVAGRSPLLQRTYRLEDFIVGPSNQLAYNAALEILKDSGPPNFNSLFIYGSIGLGKTHILQGIWNSFKERGQPLKAVYMPAEDWTNEFIHALKGGKVEGFRHKYRKVDVFLMDDVRFLSSKEGIQEELVHTINALAQSSKRMIFASDAHPKLIKELKESLANRMIGGMLAEIHPPDFKTTLAIVQTKVSRLGHSFSREVLVDMTDGLKGRSIREIESAITALLAQATTYQREVDVKLVKEVFNHLFGQRRRRVSLEDIEAVIRNHFHLTAQELWYPGRRRSLQLPRQLCCYFARTLTNHSHEEIGHHFGNKRHTFCVSSMGKIKKRLENDMEFVKLTEELHEEITRKTLA